MKLFDPREYTALPLYGLAVVLMGLSVGYVGFVGVTRVNVAKGSIPFLLAATLVNTGRYVTRHEFDLWQALQATTWGVGTALGAGWMAFVVLFLLVVDGVVVEGSAFVFLTSMSGGAAAGAALGVSKVRVTQERRKLARERARVERMNQRLRVINRVLRHNFQNKLNVLRLWAGRVTEEVDVDVVDDYSDTIVETVTRLEELTEKTRNLEAVTHRAELVDLDLATVVDQQVAKLSREHPGVTVETDLERDVSVRAHRMLETAVAEVLENTVVHNDVSTTRIGARLRSDAGAGEAILEVADDGSGIPADERAAVEDGDETPLFHGSGMGLWLVRAIVTESGGDLAIATSREQGTVVELRFPLASAAAADGVTTRQGDPEQIDADDAAVTAASGS